MNESASEQFIQAYEEYAEALYRHCYFRVYSKEKAQDLVSETFYKTWDYIASGKQVENMRAFLYRVANNLVIDFSRKKKEESLEAALEISPQLEPSIDIRTATDNRLMISYIHEVMKQLPEDSRQIILLRYVDDLDPKDIAVVLNITPNDASVRLNRAHEQLKRLLEERKPERE
jgi:RNA polymerase sigma-70 factor (ECF subfamily)